MPKDYLLQFHFDINFCNFIVKRLITFCFTHLRALSSYFPNCFPFRLLILLLVKALLLIFCHLIHTILLPVAQQIP